MALIASGELSVVAISVGADADTTPGAGEAVAMMEVDAIPVVGRGADWQLASKVRPSMVTRINNRRVM